MLVGIVRSKMLVGIVRSKMLVGIVRSKMLVGIVRSKMQRITWYKPKQITGITSNSDLSIPVYAHSAQITVCRLL